MNITYYDKVEPDPEHPNNKTIATFGVHFSMPLQSGQLFEQTINNCAIVKGKSEGWFIAMPTFKRKSTDSWEKVNVFPKEIHEFFIKHARDAIQEYAKNKGEKI